MTRSRARKADAALVADAVKLVRAQRRPGRRGLAQPVDETRPGGVLRRRGGDGSVLWRCRKALMPVEVLAGLAAAAGVGRAAVRYGSHPDGVRAGAVVAATLAGLVAYVACRAKAKRRRWRLAVACSAGAIWLAVTIAVGFSYPAAVVLVAGGWALAADRLRRVRIANPADAPSRGPGGESITAKWERYVAPRLVKGSRLLDRKTTEHTELFTGRLDPAADHHLGDVMQALPKIAVKLGVPMAKLLAERHPEVEDPSYFRFQVVTKSPIQETVYYQGPAVEDGRIMLGPYADGVGRAFYRLTTRKRVWGGFALGSTGTGKTRLTEEIAIGARSTGAVTTIYVDGQNGASSAALMYHASWAAGQHDAPELLTRLWVIYRLRNEWNRRHGLAGFTPSPDRPLIFVIVEECQDIFTAQNAKMWGQLARAGGKVGIAIFASSQYNTLDDTFGNSGPLRDSLYSGNKIVMRTESSMAKNLVPGLQVDPFDLPQIPGYGFVVASPEIGGRTAPFRAEYPPDDEDKADDPSIPVPTVNEWLGRYPDAELELEAALAMCNLGSGDVHASSVPAQAATLVDIPAPLTGRPEPAPSSRDAVLAAVRGGARRTKDVVAAVELGDRQVRTLLGQLVDDGLLTKLGHGEYGPADAA